MEIRTWFTIGLLMVACSSVVVFLYTRHLEKNLDEKHKSWIASLCVVPVIVITSCLILVSSGQVTDLGLANQVIGFVITVSGFSLFLLQIRACIKSWYRFKRG